MLESELYPETSMHPSPQLREALSWKLVSELHRRHPDDFTVIETHPGGGQYDCLSLRAGSQTVADLNRVGGFNVFSGGQSIPWQELWPASLVEGVIADLLDRMSKACGFSIPAQLSPTGPETLVYRFSETLAARIRGQGSATLIDVLLLGFGQRSQSLPATRLPAHGKT